MSNNRFYIDKPDETIQSIIEAAYPGYRGKKLSLCMNVPTELNSYWDGGSRDYYVFVNLDTMKAIKLPSNHPFYERGVSNQLATLPSRIVLVKHCIFCGKDMGLTIYANQGDLSKMLPEPPTITGHESIVLEYTSSLKNTYGGRTNIRFLEANREKGITADQWEKAKADLISRGLLRKNGSITPAGRNAIPNSY